MKVVIVVASVLLYTGLSWGLTHVAYNAGVQRGEASCEALQEAIYGYMKEGLRCQTRLESCREAYEGRR